MERGKIARRLVELRNGEPCDKVVTAIGISVFAP